MKTGFSVSTIFLIILLILSFFSSNESTTNIEVYFCPKDNCENIFIKTINNSKTLDCAFYDLNLKSIEQQLVNARVIMEKDNLNNRNFKSDKKSSYMHNKFCIINKTTVITGSMNPTTNGAYKNNNNLLIINSKEIAKTYTIEFEELYYNKKNEKSKITNYDNIQIFFCPEDNCANQILKEIKSAQQSIYFITFSFTHDLIAASIVSKKLEVKGIIENSQRNVINSEYQYLLNNTMNVKLDSNPNNMHHKVFIIDNTTVITGSMNPTKNGDTKNDENLIIIKDKIIAEKYLQEFKELFSNSKLS